MKYRVTWRFFIDAKDEGQAAEEAKSQIWENLRWGDGFVFVVEPNEQHEPAPDNAKLVEVI